ncbi:MAG TPA: PTS sugar transporter subunit IIB, partial [Tissierellaceae bacterium]|nr:PTS sugar transporter subunit IIB [Tissierellaceae bacterium]
LILIVAKTPQIILKLVEGGVPIDKVNIGNMHFSEGKKQITSTVSIDEEDAKTFRRLDELGVKLEIRRVPSERATNILEFI